MMTIIKQGIITILVFFAVFFFMPVTSFAFNFSEYTFNDLEFVISNGDYSNSGSNIKIYTAYSGESEISLRGNYDTDISFYNGRTCIAFTFSLNILNQYSIQPKICNLNFGQYSEGGYKYNTFSSVGGSYPPSGRFVTDLNLPVFVNSDYNQLMIDVYNYLANGVLNNSVQELGTQSIDAYGLGFIKPSYYVNGNTVQALGAQQLETINWQNESTTGYDLTQSGVKIQFAMKDNSYLTGSSKWWGSGLNNLIDNIDKVVRDYVYPTGSSKDVTIRGIGRKSAINGQMMNLRIVDGTSKPQTFRVIDQIYNNRALNTDDTLYQQVNNYMSGGKSWYDSLIDLVNPVEVGNISWNLYARIIAPDGTKGNWYLINKHGTPFQNQSDRINGGVTGKPVKLPNFEPGDILQPAPDDEDIPDEDIQEDDTVNNEPLPTGYVDPPSGGSDPSAGDTYNYYNNYTYNYDNRSWIENHYNNETVSDSDEGLSWIKLFSGFFGIFLILFGPFLPEWAVTLVTIATPIIIGLAVFKVIKGVIPFI